MSKNMKCYGTGILFWLAEVAVGALQQWTWPYQTINPPALMNRWTHLCSRKGSKPGSVCFETASLFVIQHEPADKEQPSLQPS
jgi:hypothetical protein